LVALALVTLSSEAWAQSNAVSAEALFDRGRQLMAQGKYAEACPKLEESQRLDPGVGTLLNLGDCYDKNGQLALAWATFRQADSFAAREGQNERAKYARRRADEIEKRLATLTIDVPVEARVPGLQVFRDGDEVREPLWGIPIPVDPGAHTVEGRAPGYKSVTLSVTATRGTAPVSVPPLEKLPPPVVEPPPIVEPPPPAPVIVVTAPPPPTPPPPPPSSGQRIAGITITVAGVATVAAGAVFGAFAIGRNSAATDAGCDKTTCPTNAGIDATNDALTFARVSTWTFVAGAVVAAAGLVVWLTSPSSSPTRAGLRIGPAGVGGTF
jgi:serine/threonine-protein kinase